MELGAWSYVGAFGISALLALFLTPVALRVALSREVLDHPGHYKTQESPVPYLGGVAIVLSFSLTILLAGVINPPASGIPQLFVMLALGVGLSLVGLADDLRGLSPLLRIGAQVAAAIAIWWSGVEVSLFDHPIPDAILTVIWIVGITNAFNLLDNMDGLSAGIATIAAVFFFIIAVINGQFLVAGLSIALAGCAIGFLRHNFHPARIYMGDAGSLFLGFLLAVLGIKLRFDAPPEITFMVPILVLGVAILDTTLVTVTRLVNGRNPLSGGRDHISHRLVFVGIPVRAAVALVYAAGIALGWLAIVMSQVDRSTGFILMGFVVAVSIFVAIMLGLIPVHEQSRRRRMMIMEVVPHEEHSGPPDNQEAASEAL